MAANFLHGVETIEINDGPRPVRLVKSSVVGLIGTAGSGPVNQNVLVTKYGDIAQFGISAAQIDQQRRIAGVFRPQRFQVGDGLGLGALVVDAILQIDVAGVFEHRLLG